MSRNSFLLRVFLASFGAWGKTILEQNDEFFQRLFGESFSAQTEPPFSDLLQAVEQITALPGEASPAVSSLKSVLTTVSLFSGGGEAAVADEQSPEAAEAEFPFPAVLAERSAEQAFSTFKIAVETYISHFREGSEAPKAADRADTFIRNLEYLSQKHLWPVAAGTAAAIADMALCDYLKVKMAIAGCWYRLHLENGKQPPAAALRADAHCLRIFAADFSGIQRFLFDLKSADKAASRLRARSFLVQALMEDVKLEFFREFGTTNWDILAEAGGKFFALLPDLPGMEEKEGKFQDKLDTLCCGQFQAEVRIHTGLSPAFAADELAGRSGSNTVFHRAGQALARKKQQPFVGLLTRPESAVLLSNHPRGVALCPACRKLPVEEGKQQSAAHSAFFRTFTLTDCLAGADGTSPAAADADDERQEWCHWCRQDVRIGDALRRREGKRYVVFRVNDNPADRYVWVLDRDAHAALAEANERVLLRHPVKAAYTGSHVPAAAEFEAIAQQAAGDPLLGILKGDIDNLGLLMRCGLTSDAAGEEGAGIVPLARSLTFSRTLDLFFSGFLPAYLDNHPIYASMYSVFAGGDDFVLIGPWDKAVAFVYELRRLFADYCGHNPDLHFSAALFFCRYKYPVFRAIRDAEADLKKAKDHGRRPHPDTKHELAEEIATGKNAFRLFGQTIPWAAAGSVKTDMEQLACWLADGTAPGLKRGVSYGFVRDLLEFADMHEEEAENPRLARWRPLLAYQLSRNINTDNPDASAIQAWVQPLLALTPQATPEAAWREKYLSAIARYALHRNRTSFSSDS